mmetsp:Transcript_47858/g.120647  ORF Transcript_47858/g.120647 Transcript_47858/m.120647 type:complete len:86 (-) Transcript_47858:57-314(-)
MGSGCRDPEHANRERCRDAAHSSQLQEQQQRCWQRSSQRSCLDPSFSDLSLSRAPDSPLGSAERALRLARDSRFAADDQCPAISF